MVVLDIYPESPGQPNGWPLHKIREFWKHGLSERPATLFWSTALLEATSNSIIVILLGLGDFKPFRGPLNQLSRGQLCNPVTVFLSTIFGIPWGIRMGCMSNASSRFLFRELIRPQSWGHELEEMEADPNNLEFANYNNDDAPLQLSHHVEKSWDEAYHGTWFYGLWSLLYHGILLESRNVGEGRLLFSCSLQHSD